jgi:methyl-accepting chemotaxis protein
MKIRYKLALSFGLLMSIILIEIVLNRIVSNNANNTYLKLKKEAIPAMNTLAKYEAINREVFLLIVSKTYTQKVSFKNQNRINGILEVEFPYLKNEIFLLKENLKPNDPKIQKIQDIISYTNEMILLIEKLNNMLVSSNDFSNTTKMKLVNSILDNDITKYNSSLHNQLKSLQLNYNGLLEEYQNEFSSGLKSISDIILITGILGVLLGFAISFKMISYISKPISQLRRAAFEISKGNYGNEIIIKGKDEFFKLSKSFNRMSASLHANFKLIAEQEERFKLMVESSPNALILSNKYGEIILTNKNFIIVSP